MDTHLEVVVIPVSDVDRAKAFFSMLGDSGHGERDGEPDQEAR